MTYLELKKSEIRQLTDYLLQVARDTNVDRLAEIKKAVTMILNAYDFVVEHEKKKRRR